MNEIAQKNLDFTNVYNRSYRLAAAVFAISNVINQNEELRTKIKSLSLDLVSASVNLKDINFSDAKKSILNIEKNSLELMSLLDIASVSGLLSKMNTEILKEEFQLFIIEIGKFAEKFEDNKNVSAKNILSLSSVPINNGSNIEKNIKRLGSVQNLEPNKNEMKNLVINGNGNSNGLKRKSFRKNAILDFVKGHNNTNIKDIVPNIKGCSEKTIQRELIELINEGKIKKVGERRWSRYCSV